MEASDFLLIAAFTLAYGLISARLERTVITAPMVFVAFGWLAGGDALGLIEVGIDDEIVVTVMELALVVVLFTDAARIDMGSLRSRFRLPLRVLASLPFVILAGGLLAVWLLPGLSIWEAMVLGVVLAPTDAALGQVVVTSTRVPQTVRQTLNVESGLNDGLALPFLAVALAIAGATGDAESVGFWVRFAALQVGVAVLIGVAVGFVGGRLVSIATRARWMNTTFERLSSIALAVLAYGAAVALDGSGFIAAFVAGLTLGATARDICPTLYEFGEAEGQLLTLVTFLLFGAAAVGPAFGAVDWRIVVYAVLSLTAVRMVPVALSLLGTALRPYSVGFIGWFGPRGIASILFALLVLEEMEFGPANRVFLVAAFTVVLSVFAHGVTALPAARHYGAAMERRRADESAPMHEFTEAPDMPARMRARE